MCSLRHGYYRFMKIKVAFAILTTIILGLFAVLSISVIEVTDILNRESKDLMKAGESIRVAQELKSHLLTHNRNSFFNAITKDITRSKGRKLQREEIIATIQEMSGLIGTEREGLALVSLKNKIVDYFNRRDELLRSSLSSIDRYDEISHNVDEILDQVDRLIEMNRQHMSDLSKSIAMQNNSINRLSVIILFSSAIILFLVFIIAAFFITNPIVELAKAISKYTHGNFKINVSEKGLLEVKNIQSAFNRMVDKLENKKQMQIQFIAAVAHDLRNPLSSMAMASEILLTKCSQENQKLIGIISRQVANLDRLVGDLLDTSRIEAGKIELNRSQQDIVALVADAVELNRLVSSIHSFKLDLPDKACYCYCDGRRISQVINNLISNAIKYSPDGGLITARVAICKNEVTASIEDQGIGINSQDAESIFIPFQRSEATKNTIPGVGLGLSASRRIIESHGGALKVESQPGHGSKFYFTLPIADQKS